MEEAGRFREVLIFVAGTTPQILTETLYGLVFQYSILPDEVHVITTLSGRRAIEQRLFAGGWWEAFFREFDLEPIPQEKVAFLLVQDGRGDPLEDIREVSHNEAVGDLIADFIRKKAGDPASRLHCSLAGGRKTMSFYLGSALQLFGRPWDRLYHVLVTPEFESHPEFYFKPKENRVLVVRDSRGVPVRTLHTRDASIILAELPFIRLRDKVALEGASFRRLVAEGQKELDAASVQKRVRVDLRERQVWIGDRPVSMGPVQIMLYCSFLRDKLQRCPIPGRPLCLECTACFRPLVDLASRQFLETMAEDYRRMYGPRSGRVENLLLRWKEGFDLETLRQHISKINRALREALHGDALLPLYVVSSVGRHGSKRYGVRVERGRIQL
jgi:CRISPR-associated protein Csx14